MCSIASPSCLFSSTPPHPIPLSSLFLLLSLPSCFPTLPLTLSFPLSSLSSFPLSSFSSPLPLSFLLSLSLFLFSFYSFLFILPPTFFFSLPFSSLFSLPLSSSFLFSLPFPLKWKPQRGVSVVCVNTHRHIFTPAKPSTETEIPYPLAFLRPAQPLGCLGPASTGSV